MTSGFPGRPESCPIAQPLIPARISRDRNFHSVDFVPRDLLRLITRERVAASNLSTTVVRSAQYKMIMKARRGQHGAEPNLAIDKTVCFKAIAWRLINSGGSAFPIKRAT